MPLLTFYGASDDLIEVEGIPGGDEYGAAGYGDKLVMGVFAVGGQMTVTAIYDGCWSFAVGQIDEDIPLPNWPVEVRQSTKVSYSTELRITVPDGLSVSRIATK